MKFTLQGNVTAPFNGYSEIVAAQVGSQHTGLDEQKGWFKPWLSDNDAIIYKVLKDRYPAWQAVYGIVEDDSGVYEFVYGHFKEIPVTEGQLVKAGDILGYEGNAGEVYSGGRRVTDEEKINGSTAGAHCHRGIRPVKKVSVMKGSRHYLKNSDGSAYKYHGSNLEIINNDENNGWIDPYNFMSKLDKLEMLVYHLNSQNRYGEANNIQAVIRFIRSFY